MWSLDSFETKGWTVHMTLCAVCIAWAVLDELPKLLISTSVLFWCYCYEWITCCGCEVLLIYACLIC